MRDLIYRIRWYCSFEERWHLYEFINKNPDITINDLVKKVGWSVRKTKYHVNRLTKGGLIKKSVKVINGFAPKTIKELINWDEMTNTKNPQIDPL